MANAIETGMLTPTLHWTIGKCNSRTQSLTIMFNGLPPSDHMSGQIEVGWILALRFRYLSIN